MNTSKYIESKFSIFTDDDYLSFNPGVSAILGTQNFVQKCSLDHSHRLDAENLIADDPDGPAGMETSSAQYCHDRSNGDGRTRAGQCRGPVNERS